MEKNLEAILNRYVSLGFHLLPVYPRGKNPIGSNHQKNASNDFSQIIKWSKEYHGCNWGLMPNKSGLVVVDVDVKNGGLEYWKELCTNLKLDVKTLTQKSGSGGLHLIFKAKPDLIYGSPLSGSGIDCQWKRIIVLAPSVNEAGGVYEWLNDLPIAEMPEELEKLFARPETDKKPLEDIEALNLGSYFEKIAAQLKTKELDYNSWISIGMALHSALPNEKGLALWEDISRGPSYKDGDEEQCRYKWSGFSKRDDGLSIRSLGYIARELGCEVPNLFLEADKLEFATERQKIDLEAETHSGWFTDDNGRLCTRHKDFAINWINEQGFFICREGSNGDVMQLLTEKSGYRKTQPFKPAGFSLMLDKRFFKEWVWTERKGWHEKYTKITKLWVESDQRQEYNRIVFAPKADKDDLNLWSPLPLAPIKGDVKPFLELIFDGIANGDLDKGSWLLDWLAHIVQKPYERSSLVPVIIGDQGTGKGMLFDRIMMKLLGHFHYKINTARILKERFNDDQICRLLTLIDEASWRGDKEEDGILKGLTGSKFMTYEQKFGGRRAIENFSRYVVLSNNPEAIAIERSNRRYIVFETNPAYRHRHDLFDILAEEVDNGALANHIFDYLMSRDISKFKPNVMVEFGDGQGHVAKVNSEGVEAQFWNDLFLYEPRRLWSKEGLLFKEIAYENFLNYAKEINSWEKSLSREKFWRKTNQFLGTETPKRLQKRIKEKRFDVVTKDPKECAKTFAETLKIKISDDFNVDDFTFSDEDVGF